MKSYERDAQRAAYKLYDYGRPHERAAFFGGADWCRAYMEDEIKDRDKTIAELAGALEFLHKNVGSKAYSDTDLWGDVMERVYRTTRDALTTHAEAIKRARGI